jgi:hypothetical protein
MKLSEAIRLGGTLHPQRFGAMVTQNAEGHVVASCALGGALIAVGWPIAVLALPRQFIYPSEWGMGEIVVCPVDGASELPLRMVVAVLNDQHRWTREQIAEWVETVEVARTTERYEPETEREPVCA